MSRFTPRLYYAASNPLMVSVRGRRAPHVLPTIGDTVKLNEPTDDDPTTPHNPETGHSVQSMSLSNYLMDRVPSLFKPYHPSWWLPTGHLQTLYIVTADFSKVDPVEYRRTHLRLPDGGTLGLDFTPITPAKDQDPTSPVIVVLHGLTGGSDEAYVRSILSTAVRPKKDGGLGYRAVVVNFRGCAGVPLTSSQFYSAGHTDDIRTALLYISAKYPRAPLFGIGFSLGANVLTRYLGEEGERSRLRAGCVLACPWNIVANSKELEGGVISRQFYSKALGGNLVALLKANLPEIEKHPPSLLSENIPKVLALKNPTLKEVDEQMVRVAGGSSPPFPFPTADDYYEWARSDNKVAGIRVPFISFNAMDDPVVATIPTHEAEKNKYVMIVTTSHGGHLGWFEGRYKKGQPAARWIKKPVLEWFAAMEDLETRFGAGSGADVGNPREIKDGFVVEPGHPFVGYKVVETDLPLPGRKKAQTLAGL